MKVFTITTTIEAEDEYDTAMVARQLDRDANRGDGIYIRGLISRGERIRWNPRRTIQERKKTGR